MAINKVLLRKYNGHGPRYTFYPPATQFNNRFTKKNYFWHTENSNEDPLPKPLSLYIQLPFYDALYSYYACDKFTSPKTSTVINYLANIKREIKMQAQLFNTDRSVQHVHLSCAAPSCLSIEQVQTLIETIKDNFVLLNNDDFELSIDVDLKTTSHKNIISLANLGFNRINFGIQDFIPSTLKAINPTQTQEDFLTHLQAALNSGVRSISADLTYGLPKQNIESFSRTLNKIIDIQTQRISLYNYAHTPEFTMSRSLINTEDMPDTNSNIELMAMSIQRLLDTGYIHIGMDHFALPNDSLSLSLNNNTLHKNFQGYSTHGDCDIIGFGVSAISHVGDCYIQNTNTLSEYKNAIESGEPALARGYNLSKDDTVRIEAIEQLMCNRRLNLDTFSVIHALNTQQYFDKELQALEKMVAEGLVTIENKIITITDDGCLFLRNIAMIFNRYN
jgi:oxygen-independent coproporphyrinogen-3 oxidase